MSYQVYYCKSRDFLVTVADNSHVIDILNWRFKCPGQLRRAWFKTRGVECVALIYLRRLPPTYVYMGEL